MCGTSDEAMRQSRAIDKFMTNELKKSQKELKVLLLGTGESGKTTLIKQMRINYGEGFDDDYLIKLRPCIYTNVYNAVQYLINGMTQLNYKYATKSISNRNIEEILDVDTARRVDEIPDKHQEIILKIFGDSNVKRCIIHHDTFHLTHSALYFLNKLSDIFDENYIPTIEDILMERTPSTGIREYLFSLQQRGSRYIFRMIDVGGQKNERRKWIHAFEKVNAVIYLTAISEFDQEMEEEKGENRLLKSLELFQQVANLQWFPPKETSLLLFLNKIDLFSEKVKQTSFNKYFPSYSKGDQDINSIKKFIENLFFSQNARRVIYSHFTCAIDTKQIKRLFEVIKDNLIEAHLSQMANI